MLTAIHLDNFKCFLSQEVKLGTLTVLAGLNGMGKSSVIQGLLLFRQMLDAPRPMLNGPWVRLGDAKEIRHVNAESDYIAITITMQHERELRNYALYFGSNENSAAAISAQPGTDLIHLQHHPFRDFWYLSADRWGPRTSLPMAEERENPRDVGIHGEFTAHYLAIHGQSELRNFDMPTHPSSGSRLLDPQVGAWLSEITPGVRLSAQTVGRADLSYSNFRFEIGSDLTPELRAPNVGFGLSYALPAIIALLAVDRGGLVLIENPEAHLHPGGQTTLGRLAALTAAAGAQVIIETHSDHLVDGVRIAVKNRMIRPEDVSMHYFGRDDLGESKVASPQIAADGGIDQWPKGFFDQSLINLAKLGP